MGRPDPLPQERRRRISRSSREKVYNNLSVTRLRVIKNPRAIQREWKKSWPSLSGYRDFEKMRGIMRIV